MAVLTTQGKEWIVDKMQSVEPRPAGGNGGASGPGLCDRIWWGTGSVAEAVGNTFANVTEASENRTTGTLSQPTTTTDRCVGTITATGSKNITESGRTNTSTKGDTGQILFMRALFTSVPVETNDQITFTHDYVQT